MNSNIAGDPIDPYRNFRLRLGWGAGVAAGFSSVSGLERGDVISHRTDGEPIRPRLQPGQAAHAPILLKRGVTYDTAFQIWVNKVLDHPNAPAGQSNPLQDLSQELTLGIYNEAGQKVFAYLLHRAWPSELRGTAELDGQGNAFVIESLILQTEGWERDASVPEPKEPGFTL